MRIKKCFCKYLSFLFMCILVSCQRTEPSDMTHENTTEVPVITHKPEQTQTSIKTPEPEDIEPFTVYVYEGSKAKYGETLPEDIENTLLAGLQMIKNRNRTRKYYLTSLLLQNDENVIAILMDGDYIGTGGSVFEIPRLVLEMSIDQGEWKKEREVYGDLETINSEVNHLFSKYWQKPDEASIREVLTALESDETLSSCFPEAGSRPETWKEVRDQIEIYYDSEMSSEEVIRQMIRVYGAEGIDLNQASFVVKIKRTGEISNEYPNVQFFFENDGTNGEICICCQKTEDGRINIAADPYAEKTAVMIIVP